MASIFKALDGGHLDRALFSSHVSKTKDGGKDEPEQTPFYRRLRLGRRGEGRAKTGDQRTRTPRSDAGL